MKPSYFVYLKNFVPLMLAAALQSCSRSEFAPKIEWPSGPDIASCSMSVSGSMLADGMSETKVELIIRDKRGNGIRDIVMRLQVSGSKNVIVPCSPSNSDGLSKCAFTSTEPGEKSIKALGDIVLEKKVVLLAPKPMSTLFGFVATGDAQALPSGNRIVSTAGIPFDQIELRDSSNTIRIRPSHLGTILTAE